MGTAKRGMGGIIDTFLLIKRASFRSRHFKSWFNLVSTAGDVCMDMMDLAQRMITVEG